MTVKKILNADMWKLMIVNTGEMVYSPVNMNEYVTSTVFTTYMKINMNRFFLIWNCVYSITWHFFLHLCYKLSTQLNTVYTVIFLICDTNNNSVICCISVL